MDDADVAAAARATTPAVRTSIWSSRARQLRDRLSGRDSDSPLAVITPAGFFELAFGRPPDAAETATLDALMPDHCVRTGEHAHRILAAFDAQTHPTTMLARASTGNLTKLELDRFALWVDADDRAVSAVIVHDHDWEPHVSAVLRDALRPGSTFVDIGANVGFHTFLAASIVGTAGAVVAVEPSAENCRLLLLSKSDNEADSVSILPFALDREPGVRYITAHIGTNAGLIPGTRDLLLDGRGTPVYVSTLDEVAPAKVDVLKGDVEGAEFRVLDGGRRTLERDRPMIVMEFSCEMSSRVSEVEPFKALQDVLDMGYLLYVLERTAGARVSYPSADALHQEWSDPLRIEDLLLVPA